MNYRALASFFCFLAIFTFQVESWETALLTLILASPALLLGVDLLFRLER